MYRRNTNLQEAIRLEEEDDRMDDLGDGVLGHIEGEISLFGRLIDIVDTSKALNLTSPRFRVEALPVGLLAVFEWSSDVDEEEVGTSTTVLEDSLLRRLAGFFMGGDGGSNDGSTSSRELGSNVGDALDILMPVLSGETEL